MMEAEYNDLMKQEYILVKHGGLSRRDVAHMSQEDRNIWIRFMNEERDREEEAYNNAKSSKAPNMPKIPSIPK